MQVYTIKDLQAILHISRNTAYELMRSQGFPSFKINRRIYVTEEAFNKWLSSLSGKEFITS